MMTQAGAQTMTMAGDLSPPAGAMTGVTVPLSQQQDVTPSLAAAVPVTEAMPITESVAVSPATTAAATASAATGSAMALPGTRQPAGGRSPIKSPPSGRGKPGALPSSSRIRVPPNLLLRWQNPNWWDYVMAWWEGYDTDALIRVAKTMKGQGAVGAAGSAAKGATLPSSGAATALHGVTHRNNDPMMEARAFETADLDTNSTPVWTVERVKGAELLWGPDATGPSDPIWMVDAVRPFGLGPQSSALDLSAGLGGAARMISKTYDTWVTGLEPSPVLATLAMQRSKMAGQGKKAPVTAYDPETFNQAGSFDLVYGDRLLHRIHDKTFFLDKTTECIKSRGGFLMFDYVIQDTPQSWEAWNRWRDIEAADVSPWTVKRFADELIQRNMDVRITENLTELHREQILARIKRLSDALNDATVEGGVLSGIARELALWWARLKVLGRGLQFYRFVSFKLA